MINCCCDSCVSCGSKNCPLVNAEKDIDLLNAEIGKLQEKRNSLETEVN